MKKLLFTLTLAGALALGGQSAFAQAKKKSADAPAAAAEKPKAAPAAEKPKANKPIPMYIHADEIDAAAKTITQVAKDGKKSTNSVTATTIIENDKKPAKFEDIKVGDMVSGNRTKTGDSTYDIVKITKFSPKAEKPAAGGVKKPASDAKKPAEKKDDAPAKPAAQ